LPTAAVDTGIGTLAGVLIGVAATLAMLRRREQLRRARARRVNLDVESR